MNQRQNRRLSMIEAYEKIERMYDGPYIEIWGRNQRAGWDVFGNDTQKFEVEAAE